MEDISELKESLKNYISLRGLLKCYSTQLLDEKVLNQNLNFF